MTAELNAHGNLMGGVRKTVRPQKLKMKRPKKRVDEKTNNKGLEKEAQGSEEAPRSIENKSSKQEPIKVASTRVFPNSPKSNDGSSSPAFKSEPSEITPPGPTAREWATMKSNLYAKGIKNTSTVKVAEPSVNLEEGPDFGKPVYTITDVPRQWKKNG